MHKDIKKDKKEWFTTAQFSTVVENKQASTFDWINRGYVTPDDRPGQGSKALFSIFNLYEGALFKKIIKVGIARDDASQFVNAFMAEEKARVNKGKSPSSYIIFRITKANGKMEFKPILVEKGSWLLELGHGCLNRKDFFEQFSDVWESIVIINYTELKRKVDEAIKKL